MMLNIANQFKDHKLLVNRSRQFQHRGFISAYRTWQCLPRGGSGLGNTANQRLTRRALCIYYFRTIAATDWLPQYSPANFRCAGT